MVNISCHEENISLFLKDSLNIVPLLLEFIGNEEFAKDGIIIIENSIWLLCHLICDDYNLSH